MADRENLSWVKSALEAQATLEPPRVERVQPQVRSGANIPALSGKRDDLEHRAGHCGNVIIEWGYDVPRNKRETLARVVGRAEAAARGTDPWLPEGLTYCGTFGVVFSSEKGAGRYRTIWSLDCMENIGALGGLTDENHAALNEFIRELKDLWDPHGGWSESLYQAV